MTTPRRLAIDDVAVGMALADPVLGAQGEVVLSQGVALTDALISALRRRGVESLAVVDGEHPQAVHTDPVADLEFRMRRLARLFRNSDGQDDADQGGAQRLRVLVTQYRTGEMP